MKRYRDHTNSTPLKDDASRIELLPIESEAGSYNSPPTNNGQDSAEGQSHKTTRLIKGWPQSFKTLKKTGWKEAGSLAVDTFIALIPLLFTVLSIVATRLSGSPISAGGDKVKAAITLGPTLFPILFAAIVGRSLRSLASFQAERGAKLGTLEQLMGSLTIFGTVELQILLRTFDVLGIGLIALWALSPLGGQASLRLLEIGKQPILSVQNISYLDPELPSIFSQGADATSSFDFYINALYLSALLSPPASKASSVDTWSNVKIPTIEKLESTGKSDADGWYDVSPGNTAYSSLVGLPIDGIRKNGSYHFYVESLYMVLDCPIISDFTTTDESPLGGFSLDFVTDNSTYFQLYPNQTSYPAVKTWGVNFSAGSDIDSDNAFVANCTVTRSSVESNITCDHGSCSVTQIRRSKFDKRPPGYTLLTYGVGAPNFATYWPKSGGSGEHPGSSTPTEYFIADPTMDSLSTSILSGGISLQGLSADLFSERFSLVFNTYWQCSLVPWYQTGNFPSNASAINDNPVISSLGTFNTTTTTVTNFTDIYVCNRMWAAILFVASIVLLLCGICGVIVKHMARGPIILGYVSTMTRDNPYIDLPSGGCTLDGLQRAKLLKDIKVKVQDVAAEGGVGHIAFGSAETFGTGKLIPGRLYA
ncbi:MAG: hypothetical protein ASARMPREDX12_003254 [Alectoria sarmentosa]|nr:MAG: hypothetical protein ASARMPREDX12_003254 [Alectoria sarmentosa]